METIVTENNFEQILASPRPVLVDFWAPWCGPCRSLAPVIEEISAEFAGRLDVAKCNVDDYPELSMKYGIRSIPTLIYFKDGELKERSVGLVSKNQIIDTINKIQ